MKIEKAEKKAKEEHLECRKLDEEIRQYCDQLEKFHADRDLELKMIETGTLYKNYLEWVAKEYEEDFEADIDNLLNRYRTLEDGHSELLQANQKLSDMHDATSEEWRRVKTELQNERLMIESALQNTKVQYEKYRSKSIALENRLNAALEDKVHKESSVGVIQMATEQLFTRAANTCRLEQRKNAMLEFAANADPKYGSRVDRVLSSVMERIQELQWILEEATATMKARADANPVLEEKKENDGTEVPTFVTKLPEEIKNAVLSGSQVVTKARTTQSQPETKHENNEPEAQPSQAAPSDTVFLTQ